MATYGDMISEIQFNLDRSITVEDDYVKQNIVRAINQYHKDRFVWNEKVLTLTLTSGTDAYDSGFVREDGGGTIGIEDIYQVDWIFNAPAGSSQNTYDLRRLGSKSLESFSNSTSSGQPVYFDINTEFLRLYPAPSAADVLTLKALISVSDLTRTSASNEGATNPWVNDAEYMVMAKALSFIYQNFLKDLGRSREFAQVANQEFQRHRSDYERKNQTDKGVVPWYGESDLDRGVSRSFY